MPQSWLEEVNSRQRLDDQVVRSEEERCLLEVEGTLPMLWVGILVGLSDVLANAGISIFCVSTFDSDYLLLESSQRTKVYKLLSAGLSLT